MKRILRIFCFTLLFTPMLLRAQYTFVTNGAWVEITRYTGSDNEVTVPDTLNGYPVRGIVFPAFFGCSLRKVNIPLSVTNISGGSFERCYYLTNFTISSNVVVMDQGSPFYFCTNLANIDVDPANQNFCSVEGVVFDKNTKTLLVYPPAKRQGDYVTPPGVENVAEIAFSCVSYLTNIFISEGVTNLPKMVFAYGGSLQTIVLPQSMSGIGPQWTLGCNSLRAVYLKGNAPTGFPVGYYLPGRTGFGAGAILWNPKMETGDGNFGPGPGGFRFTVTGTTNIPIALEAAPDVSGPWTRLQGGWLTNGAVTFVDGDWTNHPARVYRIAGW